MMIDALEGSFTDNFMLHYNFPAYSVGETGRESGPKRREIGHGRLARRGVQRMLPAPDKFPYAIRVVSDITESNGSSSMASVCGASLALMELIQGEAGRVKAEAKDTWADLMILAGNVALESMGCKTFGFGGLLSS